MKGVVHVGFGDGEEVDQYMREQRYPILGFEPQALKIAAVYASFAALTMAGLLLIEPFALSDSTRNATLYLPARLDGDDDEPSASLHERSERIGEVGWVMTAQRSVVVPCMRFDEYVRQEQLDMSLFDHLVVDVQGHELAALRGFGELLRGFATLRVECSAEPIYVGGAPAASVVMYLDAFGFRQTSGIMPHGDVTFERDAHA